MSIVGRWRCSIKCWGGYDADGDLDVYFTSTGGNVGALYRNTGTGTFERATDSPIATDTHAGTGCAWADFDNDGDLDLFKADWLFASRLYLNNGVKFSSTFYESDRRSTEVGGSNSIHLAPRCNRSCCSPSDPSVTKLFRPSVDPTPRTWRRSPVE